MGKFLLGLVTGAVLIVLILVVGFFAIASLKSKPATVADGSNSTSWSSGPAPSVTVKPVERLASGTRSRAGPSSVR